MLEMDFVDSVRFVDRAQNYSEDLFEYLTEGDHERLLDKGNSVAKLLESDPVDEAVYKIEEELMEAYEAADWT
jgi:hypothetical protein